MDSAIKQGAEFLLDVRGKTSFVLLADFGEEILQMLSYELIENRLGRAMLDIFRVNYQTSERQHDVGLDARPDARVDSSGVAGNAGSPAPYLDVTQFETVDPRPDSEW